MALVLTRRTHESLMIGDDVTVTVLEVRGGSVKLGVTAPRDVPVHREEIYHKVHADGDDTAACRSNN